jgi:hypothetical protein
MGQWLNVYYWQTLSGNVGIANPAEEKTLWAY